MQQHANMAALEFLFFFCLREYTRLSFPSRSPELRSHGAEEAVVNVPVSVLRCFLSSRHRFTSASHSPSLRPTLSCRCSGNSYRLCRHSRTLVGLYRTMSASSNVERATLAAQRVNTKTARSAAGEEGVERRGAARSVDDGVKHIVPTPEKASRNTP